MYELSVRHRFSAAHRLPGYPGSCAALHGHNWDVEVFVRGRQLDRGGMLIDFRRLKQEVRRVLEPLDHAELNRLDVFAAESPTSENIARHIYLTLSQVLNGDRLQVDRVTVHETPETGAGYWEESEG